MNPLTVPTTEELDIAVRVLDIARRHRDSYFNSLLTEWLNDMESTLEYIAAHCDDNDNQMFMEDCSYETDIAHEFALIGEKY